MTALLSKKRWAAIAYNSLYHLHVASVRSPEPCFSTKTVFPCVGIPVIKRRPSRDCVIFMIGITIIKIRLSHYIIFMMGITIIMIRWSNDHLVFLMGIPIPGKRLSLDWNKAQGIHPIVEIGPQLATYVLACLCTLLPIVHQADRRLHEPIKIAVSWKAEEPIKIADWKWTKFKFKFKPNTSPVNDMLCRK